MTSDTKSDARLQTDVCDELAWDPAVPHTDIGVSVRDGVVTLNGSLRSLSEKHAAEDAVRRVAGVRGLAVEIDVAPDPRLARSDADIAVAAQHALDWDARVPAGAVQVTVEGGHVTLTGEVTWGFQRAAAAQAVRDLLGVRGLSNQLEVRPPASRDRIEQGIHDALARHADREARRVEVRVAGSTVTVRGRVGTWAERDAVRGVAWSSPGVTLVVDEMTVG